MRCDAPADRPVSDALGRGLILLLCGGLMGCAELTALHQANAPQPASRAYEPPPASSLKPNGAVASAAPNLPAAPSNDRMPPKPAKPATARPAMPLQDVRELIGLERSELQARLGEPAMLRRDAPAEIWQYRSALCVLDLFLYRDGQTVRVTNAELRPRDGREIPNALCLSSLQSS